MLSERIPFDSVTLSTVKNELTDWVGAKMQQAYQPDEHTLVLSLYRGRETWLALSWHPEFARVHLTFRKPKNLPEPSGLLRAVRSHLAGVRLETVEQIGLDRILRLKFLGRKGSRTLLLEVMGKHSNLVLLDESEKILAAGKVVGRSKSRRPILPGSSYSPPPFDPKPSLLLARSVEEAAGSDGGSPFLIRWIRSHPGGPEEALSDVRNVVLHGRTGFLSPGRGAYPLDVSFLGWESFERSSMSTALDQHYGVILAQWTLETKASLLAGQIRRALQARRTGLQGALEALSKADEAARLQEEASLLLTYGPLMKPGQLEMEVVGSDGDLRTIRIEPETDWLSAAERMFARARKLKSGEAHLREHIATLQREIEELELALAEVQGARHPADLEPVQERASQRRWLSAASLGSSKVQDKPHRGHKVREVAGPGGIVAYVGLNAEANDYVTTQLAKPNDLWLHVRGSASAHVVVPTQNRPDRITQEQLLWAARLAVQHSPSRTSGYVPVDCTLKKYVRKPKGSPAGTAFYTHEKTLHVERGNE